jgi:Alpha/beta hydrolase of unknown function (DUF900)
VTLILYTSDRSKGCRPGTDAVAHALERLPPSAPVVIMVHGFRYAPAHRRHDPAGFIYAREPESGRHMSWPWHLGFGARTSREPAASPLCIGYVWNARGTIWQAAHRGNRAAMDLAGLVSHIRRIDPIRRVTAIAHSLGASVVLSALPHLKAGDLDRAVLMSAAVLRRRARALMATPAGCMAEIINVTSRENDLFDFGMELALSGGLCASVSQGIGTALPNWIDVQIDHHGVLGGLAALGYPIAPPTSRICHWSAYTRPGMFALYRALLTDPCPLSIDRLARALPEEQEPRWSRLFSRPPPFAPLPFRPGASS